jgi:MFS family permease
MRDQSASIQRGAGQIAAIEPAAASSAAMRRIAVASFVGSTIEFYDFFIYGIAAALVFSDAFFPALGSAQATFASFATLGVAFVARPLGAILFGHLGDRLGRKRTLVSTLLVMGFATVGVGLMPTANQIGILAPVLLVVLRIIQGLAAGGEWAGASLFATENAPKAKRGFWAMFPSLGGGAALVLGNLTFLATGLFMSEAQFRDFGWRLPFLASVVLVVLGLVIRLKIDETPVFRAEQSRSGPTEAPAKQAFRRQGREILLASGTVIMVPSFTYIGASYLTNYGSRVLELPLTNVLAMGVIGGLAISAGIILGGTLSDRIGRRAVIRRAALVAIPWAALLFPLLDLESTLTFAVGVTVTMFISGVAYGPMSAYLSELFHTSYRYTASGFSYNVAQIIGGAVPPLVATPIIAARGSAFFGLCLAALVGVSLICVSLLRETRGVQLHASDA